MSGLRRATKIDFLIRLCVPVALGFYLIATMPVCEAVVLAGQGRAAVENPSQELRLHFGRHTNARGKAGFSISVEIQRGGKTNYVSLDSLERAHLAMANESIDHTLHTICLTSNQISNLRLAAALDSRRFLRRANEILRGIHGSTPDNATMRRTLSNVAQLQRDFGTGILDSDSLYKTTLNSYVSESWLAICPLQ